MLPSELHAWSPGIWPLQGAGCVCLQIGSFMTDIGDEFKIVVVEAIRSLCLKFPQKYRALMNFLSSVLREDGGFEYKKAIVDSILILIREIPDAKESGLAHLCEFIEVGCYTLPICDRGTRFGTLSSTSH